MVWDQGPSIALGLRFFPPGRRPLWAGGEDICQAIEKGVAVLVVAEELSSFNSPGHDVLEEAGGVKSGLARHCVFLARISRMTRFLFLLLQ